MTLIDRGIVTMAFGASEYLEMAKSLARSLAIHSPQIPRAIVTDATNDDEMKQLFSVCVPVNRGFGPPLLQKLFLDKYSPFRESLFIDSDCLVVRDIDRIWHYFRSLDFGIPGITRLRRGDTDPLFDVDHILTSFNLHEVSKFNSGLVYFNDSDTSKAVFSTAREIQSRHLELRFRQGDHDEAIFQVAMAINGIQAFLDDGQTMLTPAGIRGHMAFDVLKGIATFNKYGFVRHPAIVHFAGAFSSCYEYKRDCYKLRHHYNGSVRQRLAILSLCVGARRAYTLERLGALRARASLVKQRLTNMCRSVARSAPASSPL